MNCAVDQEIALCGMDLPEIILWAVFPILFVLGWAFSMAGFYTLCHAADEGESSQKDQTLMLGDAYFGSGLVWRSQVFRKGWKRSRLGRRLFLTGVSFLIATTGLWAGVLYL